MKKVFIIIAMCLLSYFSYSQMTIVSQPQSSWACQGINDTARIVVANNAADITYNILFDATYSGTFTSVHSETLSTTTYEYVFENITTASQGRYKIEVSDGVTTLESLEFNIIVSTAIPTINSITLSPNDTLLCLQAEKSITLNVSPSGNMQYSWYKNSAFYTNSSNNTLVFEHASLSDEGIYYAIISNGCGTATNISDPINLNYLEKPNLTTSPNIPYSCEGDIIDIPVAVTGDNINFTWVERIASVDNVMTGQTSSTLHIENIHYPNNSLYILIASNGCYNDTLVNFGIPTGTAPIVQTQPSAPEMCLGETFSLNAYAIGSTPFTYQWYGDSILIPNSNTTTLTVNSSVAYNDSYYYIAYNACGSDTSDVFLLEFREAPLFTIQPHDTTVCVGEDVFLNTKVVGATPLTVQWNFLYDNNAILVQDANATFANSNTQLTFTNILEAQSRPYFCIASNDCGTASSDTVMVTVNVPIELQMDLSDENICEGDSMAFSLAYTNQVFGTEPITYNWYKESTPADILISTSNIYSIPYVSLSDAGVYYCELSNMCNTIETYHADLTVKALPVFTVQPEAFSVCQGGNIYLSAEAEGESPISYLWYRNGSAISSQTTENLVIPNSIVNHSGYYYCLAQNECSGLGIKSDSVLVSVGTPVSFQNPTNHSPIAGANGTSICEFETLELKILVNGINFNVSWYNNGNLIPGQNDTILSISPDISYAGEYYCVISNQCNEITSDTIEISITPSPDVDLGDDKDLCNGESVTLETDGNYTNYTWTQDGEEMDTHSPMLTVSETGVYTLQVTDMYTGCTNIDEVNVTVHPYYEIPLSETINSCSDYYLLDAGIGAYEYTWSNGATFHSITVEESGEYSLTVTGDSFGCSDSINITLTLNPPISVSLGDDLSVDISSGTTLDAGTDFSSYEWFFGTENLDWEYPTLYVDGETYDLGTWEFSVTVGNGVCFASDTILVTFTDYNSIEDNQASNISIYPNPANDYIVIDDPENIVSKISIYTIDGKEILNDNNYSNSEININSLSAGSYFIKITNRDGNSIIKKFLKN